MHRTLLAWISNNKYRTRKINYGVSIRGSWYFYWASLSTMQFSCVAFMSASADRTWKTFPILYFATLKIQFFNELCNTQIPKYLHPANKFFFTLLVYSLPKLNILIITKYLFSVMFWRFAATELKYKFLNWKRRFIFIQPYIVAKMQIRRLKNEDSIERFFLYQINKKMTESNICRTFSSSVFFFNRNKSAYLIFRQCQSPYNPSSLIYHSLLIGVHIYAKKVQTNSNQNHTKKAIICKKRRRQQVSWNM